MITSGSRSNPAATPAKKAHRGGDRKLRQLLDVTARAGVPVDASQDRPVDLPGPRLLHRHGLRDVPDGPPRRSAASVPAAATTTWPRSTPSNRCPASALRWACRPACWRPRRPRHAAARLDAGPGADRAVCRRTSRRLSAHRPDAACGGESAPKSFRKRRRSGRSFSTRRSAASGSAVIAGPDEFAKACGRSRIWQSARRRRSRRRMWQARCGNF